MRQKKLVSTEYRLLTYKDNLNQNWCFEWFDENGKRCKKYGSINRYKTVEERYAEAEILKVLLDTGLKEPPKPINSVIFSHFEGYLVSHLKGLRANSDKCYSTILGIFNRWLMENEFKDIHPKKFTKANASLYARFLEAERKLANATYNKHLNVINMFFDYLVRDEIIVRSPFEFLKRKVNNSVSVSAFKDKDVKRLKRVLKEANMTVFVACMIDMYAFIRPTEIRNLRLKDIDFVENTITIDKSFAKNKKTMKVALLGPLKEILLEYIGASIGNDLFLLSKTGAPGVVPISSQYVVNAHNKILREQGYDTRLFKPYSWKHTGNSIAYKNGASIKFLKLQNRHSSEAMTEIYIKSIVPEDLVDNEEQYFNF